MSHHHRKRHKSRYSNPDQHSLKSLLLLGGAFLAVVGFGITLVIKGLVH